MKKIILASKSPRRIEMLSKYCEDIKVYSSEIQELVNLNDKPQTTVMKIALEKASAVLKSCDEHGIIIAADTIVYKDSILGKPKNKIEALEMLKSLNGEEHSVITGIAIIEAGTDNKIVDYEETRVKFRNLTHEKIMRYIEMEECFDKAGSYGIQGYGALLVEGIVGSYTNVVGLPITKLDSILENVYKINLI